MRSKTMSNRQKKLKKIANRQREKNVYLSEIEKHTLGIENILESPYVVLKYYQPDFECFSSWNNSELTAFSQFLLKLKKSKWTDIYKTGGAQGDKTGLGYSKHKDRSKLPKHPELDNISQDITFFELRVTQKARVHGFRVKEAFFLVWLDREHRIYDL